MKSSYSDIVEQVHQLDAESKADLIDLLRAWLAEERREQIAVNEKSADDEHAQGRTKSGSLKDLMADLYAED